MEFLFALPNRYAFLPARACIFAYARRNARASYEKSPIVWAERHFCGCSLGNRLVLCPTLSCAFCAPEYTLCANCVLHPQNAQNAPFWRSKTPSLTFSHLTSKFESFQIKLFEFALNRYKFFVFEFSLLRDPPSKFFPHHNTL